MESNTGCSNGLHRIDQFALVSYIPGPLGNFLDDLRLDLVPDCRPHAHVTILPPRKLCGQPNEAIGEIRHLVEQFSPFTVKLGDIAVFPESEVIYIEIVSGADSLRAMYLAMNKGICSFSENFPYHPHITLAQNLPHDLVNPLYEHARELWRNWTGERSFAVETLSFVQNTTVCTWLDLAEIHLPVRVGEALLKETGLRDRGGLSDALP